MFFHSRSCSKATELFRVACRVVRPLTPPFAVCYLLFLPSSVVLTPHTSVAISDGGVCSTNSAPSYGDVSLQRRSESACNLVCDGTSLRCGSSISSSVYYRYSTKYARLLFPCSSLPLPSFSPSCSPYFQTHVQPPAVQP
jgi:hypothetical protein